MNYKTWKSNEIGLWNSSMLDRPKKKKFICVGIAEQTFIMNLKFHSLYKYKKEDTPRESNMLFLDFVKKCFNDELHV